MEPTPNNSFGGMAHEEGVIWNGTQQWLQQY
jgi:hypothetical protein